MNSKFGSIKIITRTAIIFGLVVGLAGAIILYNGGHSQPNDNTTVLQLEDKTPKPDIPGTTAGEMREQQEPEKLAGRALGIGFVVLGTLCLLWAGSMPQKRFTLYPGTKMSGKPD
jgi:hypothetical protein